MYSALTGVWLPTVHMYSALTGDWLPTVHMFSALTGVWLHIVLSAYVLCSNRCLAAYVLCSNRCLAAYVLCFNRCSGFITYPRYLQWPLHPNTAGTKECNYAVLLWVYRHLILQVQTGLVFTFCMQVSTICMLINTANSHVEYYA